MASMLAAPAIVHAGNLMPVKVMMPDEEWVIHITHERIDAAYRAMLQDLAKNLYGD